MILKNFTDKNRRKRIMEIKGFIPVFLYGTKEIYFSRTRKKKNFLENIKDLRLSDLYETEEEANNIEKDYIVFQFKGVAKITITIEL